MSENNARTVAEASLKNGEAGQVFSDRDVAAVDEMRKLYGELTKDAPKPRKAPAP